MTHSACYVFSARVKVTSEKHQNESRLNASLPWSLEVLLLVILASYSSSSIFFRIARIRDISATASSGRGTKRDVGSYRLQTAVWLLRDLKRAAWSRAWGMTFLSGWRPVPTGRNPFRASTVFFKVGNQLPGFFSHVTHKTAASGVQHYSSFCFLRKKKNGVGEKKKWSNFQAAALTKKKKEKIREDTRRREA